MAIYFFNHDVYSGVGLATVWVYCAYKRAFMQMDHPVVYRIILKLEYFLL